MNDIYNSHYSDIFRPYNHQAVRDPRPNRQRPLVRSVKFWFWAVACSIAACLLLCGGCGATVTINVLSSHSRYGQAIGGTNTTIKGQIEGGGSATGTLTP